jgi:hypothetical protein
MNTALLARPCPHYDRDGKPISCTEAEALALAPNEAQTAALRSLCERYKVGYDHAHYKPTFGLPAGWVCGYVGGKDIQHYQPTIVVGCDPEGRISS